MKIKKLYNPVSMPDSMVLEDLNGNYFRFYVNMGTQYPITEDALRPVPGFAPVGLNGTEAAPYMYKIMGLEKEE